MLRRLEQCRPRRSFQIYLNSRDELVGSATARVEVGVFELRPVFADRVQQLAPEPFIDFRLMLAAGRQNQFHARVADRADGDVVQVVRVDALFEPGDEVLRLVAVGQFAVRKLVEIDLVDEDGAADQVHAEPEAALAVLILVVGTRNEAGRDQQRQQANDDPRSKWFHGWVGPLQALNPSTTQFEIARLCRRREVLDDFDFNVQLPTRLQLRVTIERLRLMR